MPNLELICRQACECVIEVGSFIREERKIFSTARVEYKTPHDLVSYVDKSAENQLVEGLSKLLPGCGFITEENADRVIADEFNWIIDPLDGTTNFVHGLPCYCVSIALKQNEELVIGIVYEINFNECFYAIKNGPAFLNKSIIRVSDTPLLSSSLLATGFPTIDYSRLDDFMQIFIHCMKHTRGLRRLGSAAADLAYVACGRLDGFFEYGLNPWDVAGGALIVKCAGGKVCDFKGEENFLFGNEILATNHLIFPEMKSVIQLYFLNEDH